MDKMIAAIMSALLAALLYAINIPLSKLLLQYVAPILMASFLYLGAGLGMSVACVLCAGKDKESRLTRKELPYTI
ncbi:MAG: EamA family transporter, partial [Fibrobacter sp.]|nr:EamA family transporter [Fibrobacter sp.]